ncbi:MAG TPA: glycosyltransferase family 4 protein, partial [Pyrinomonadaceae bacterium]|nr:glycosyltransferase family 4 protein [Pyrinomonadaceae bacterium]
MKILQISSARGFGGGERQLLSLTRGLRERGHEVHVALDPDSPLGRALTRDAAAVPCLRADGLNVTAVRNLARFVRERGVEVVHAHTGYDYPRAAAAVRLSRSRARLVLTRHVLFPMSRINRITLADASRVIAVSEAVARALRARRIFPDEKIRVVHNGVDFEAWARARARTRPRRDETLRVGIIGELSEVKGQADFVRAAALVVRRSTR